MRHGRICRIDRHSKIAGFNSAAGNSYSTRIIAFHGARRIAQARGKLSVARCPDHRNRSHLLPGRTVEDRKSVPLRGVGDLHDLLLQCLKFLIKIATLFVCVGIVNRLDRQLSHALEHAGNLVCCTFGRLNQRDGVTGITNRLAKCLNLLGDPR